MITLTDTAAVKVKELLAAEGAEDLALRVAVRPGGCSGFSYEMFFDGDIAADDDPDAPVTAVVAFANCPFADLARDHPDLVCALHRGLVAGFVARMGDAEVTEFCPLAHRTPCQVALTTR